GLQLGLNLRQESVEVLNRVLLNLTRELAQPVGIGELIEEELRALLVRCLRALVNGSTFVRRQRGGELIDGLKTHGAGFPLLPQPLSPFPFLNASRSTCEMCRVLI